MILRNSFVLFTFLFIALAAQAEVTVAVIDTGADITHPLLEKQLWTNPGESGKDKSGLPKESNGLDDDDNGYIDDVHGWNFANNTNKVTDTHGHGTHIAGIIAQHAPGASLMILKYFNPAAMGEENQRNTVRAIEYAIKMKAQIINYSAGGTDPSISEEKAIRKAAEKNIVFVAAAGNERTNSDDQGFYPANYNLPNIVSVAAVDSEKSILPSSNFGRYSVDIAAPGKNIVSAIPGGKFAAMTGTSQATAFVSAAIALLKETHPRLNTPEAIRPYLLSSAKPFAKLALRTRSGAALDLSRLSRVRNADQTPFGESIAGHANVMNAFSGESENDVPFR